MKDKLGPAMLQGRVNGHGIFQLIISKNESLIKRHYFGLLKKIFKNQFEKNFKRRKFFKNV